MRWVPTVTMWEGTSLVLVAERVGGERVAAIGEGWWPGTVEDRGRPPVEDWCRTDRRDVGIFMEITHEITEEILEDFWRLLKNFWEVSGDYCTL